MKKYLLLGGVLLAGVALQAQLAEYPSSLDTSSAVAAPPSNIDFLKRSLGSSNFSGAASSTPADNQANAPQTLSNLVPQQSPAVQTPTPQKPVKAGNVLDMPLSTGGSVQTAVPAAKTPSQKPAAKSSNKSTAKSATVKSQLKATSNALSPEEEAAQAELDYAARMLREAKRESDQSGRFIPQAASQGGYVPVVEPAAAQAFNPNDYRPNVEWQRSDSNHFIIYTQKRDGGIGSSNMSMLFESAYETLRRNIPWMMSDKVRVFVYQDHTNYLKHEPKAKAWTRALAYPTRGEIVVYDEPGKQQELKEVFTHELVHIFTQKFFDKHQSNRLMTPTWLDEGLAVYMEDQAYSGSKGGPWKNDLRTLNLQRDPSTRMPGTSLSKGLGVSNFARKGPAVYLMPFDEFMRESSLASMEARGKTQDWYLQAYAMVHFLLNPSGGRSPSNRMQFEQLTRMISQGEQVRDPASGFPVKDSKGRPMYRPYSLDKALAKVYRYNSANSFEDAFWRWLNNQH